MATPNSDASEPLTTEEQLKQWSVDVIKTVNARNPRAILDASHITDMRTGAVSAVGAKYLARKDSKAAWNAYLALNF